MDSVYFGERTEFTENFYCPKHHHLKRAIFRLFCSLVELTQPPIGHRWHISITSQCLQWFIRDPFSPRKNEPMACSLLAVWHPQPNSLLSPEGKRRGCLGLIELFNSWVMGYVDHTMILFLSANWSTKWISWSLVWWCAVVTLYGGTARNALWVFFDSL